MLRNASRRSLLAAFSAVPAATVAAALPAPIMAHPATPDAMSAEVAELSRLYDAAVRRTEAASLACEEAEKRLVRPDPPEALFRQAGDPLHRCITADPYRGRFWYGDFERIDMLRAWNLDHLEAAGWQKQIARRAEILAAYDQWRSAIKAAEDAAGVTAADEECRACWEDEEQPIRRRIVALRSSEPAALRLKVRAYLSADGGLDWRKGLEENISRAMEMENGPWEETIAASILRDLVTAYAPQGAASLSFSA